uniref:Uncharacterized protein n=1 Tax=Monopterus albus TaxID=43700 RepID=A0A3Q3JYE4_MONAL
VALLSCLSMILHCRSVRILSATGNGPVQRNLFGPIDREQLQADYQTVLPAGEQVPLLYRSCMHGLGHTGGQRVTEAALGPKGGRAEPAQSGENVKQREAEGPYDTKHRERETRAFERGGGRLQTSIPLTMEH